MQGPEKKTHSWQEKKIGTWQEARKYLSPDRTGWAWRGHGDARWRLETSLHRAVTSAQCSEVERILLRSFQRRAHHYLNPRLIPANDAVEWFALMQHHGAPSRLLDWTYSPYVAAFFALEDPLEKPCAIFAIDIIWCQRRSARLIREARHRQRRFKFPSSNIWDAETFREVFLKVPPIPLVAPVEPRRTNQRLTLQQGLFLCPGDPDRTFEDNLRALGAEEELFERVIKLVLEPEVRTEALVDLSSMNLNSAALFPGIDGFSRSLKQVIVEMEDETRHERRQRYFEEHGAPEQAVEAPADR